jgi:Helix-turn-helix domain
MAGTSDPADVRGEIRAFLSTRRAKISPAQAGLPVYRGDHRRVSGLRREEVAVLAGISIEYYTRFERGNATGVSESVIDGVVRWPGLRLSPPIRRLRSRRCSKWAA